MESRSDQNGLKKVFAYKKYLQWLVQNKIWKQYQKWYIKFLSKKYVMYGGLVHLKEFPHLFLSHWHKNGE